MSHQALKELSAIANDPFDTLKKWKIRTGKKIIGSTLADVPEELVHAAGLLPFTLVGVNRPIRRAASLLPDNCCSLDRSNLELVLSYEKDFFDGFILPQVDDTSQHLSDIWRTNVPGEYFECFLIPRQVNRWSARPWLGDEIRRLKKSLEAYTDRPITEGALWDSIQIYNRNREMLRALYEMSQEHPGKITNRQRFEAIKSSMFYPKEEHNSLLERVLPGGAQNLVPLPAFSEGMGEGGSVGGDPPRSRGERRGDTDPREPGTSSLRIVLSGITWEPPAILSILDEAGTTVVGDDLCVGMRYIEPDVPLEGDPFEALVNRHFQKSPFSPIHDGGNKIFHHLVSLVRENQAHGILYLHIKFNESQDYDLPDLKKAIRGEGIPMSVLDIEYQSTHVAPMKTRIEAFLESLR